MGDFRALCAELVEKLDDLNCHFNIPSQSAIIERVHAALAQPEPAPAADGEVIEGQLISGWLPINTAPRDGTEILASDYDAIEIVSWGERQAWHGWSDREGRMMKPSWWQPLPEHPSLPEVE